ncbi:MAG TPA: hypothetical protein VGH11_15145 [Jatrophihabitans sp.]
MYFNDFNWTLHPAAEALVDEIVEAASAKSPRLAALRVELAEQTSTRLQDWLDSVSAPTTPDDLAAVGYEPTQHPLLWRHPGAQLPAVVIDDCYQVAIRVDDVAAFAQSQGRRSDEATRIEGSPLSGYRRVIVADENSVQIAGVERRSWTAGVTPEVFDSRQRSAAPQAWQLLAERPRTLSGPQGVRAQLRCAADAVRLVGADLAASYFLQQERQYWQRHNNAGMIQHARQDRLGLGWGNNDHHTFRSSRPAFAPLIEFLATLGFSLRERFYAGAEAGWGAQVIEHYGCGGVIFADVDLTEAEVDVDFAHTELRDDDRLGTVGMWCALHGESVLAAGMHHLEGQFSFDALTDSLAERGQPSMPPFSDFVHLRQAFTEAELWPVSQHRLAALVEGGQLSVERASELETTGAAGSHLENLARRGGFKGFNQHNVSTTMLATHPRDYRPSGSKR